MGPSRSNHPNNHIEAETRHRFTIAELALKFLTYCALFLGKSLYPHSASLHLGVEMGTGELTEKPDEMLSKGLGGGNGGRNMSRTSIPARGRIAILLVTSRYRNKNRLLLDRHLGSSTDLSLYALNKKYIARIKAMKFFFSWSPLHTEKFQHRFVNVHSFYLVFHNYFDPIHLITKDAFRQ